jgi:serine/threonine-protein phosphatase 2A regulatory subunit B
MTGSYHNYFRIYDVETGTDVQLQADKSAFKAKKIGGVGGPKGLAGAKANGGKKEGINTDAIDFNKKILHGSWHPRENTIAVRPTSLLFLPSITDFHMNQIAATNNLFLYSAA